MSKKISRKVTIFVLRRLNSGIEILLINHPHTAYQFPAGTIKRDEDPRTACLREVNEETGLDDLEIVTEIEPRIKEYTRYGRLIKKAKLYARPTKYTTSFGKLRSGMKVKILQTQDEFSQIQYKERDLLDPSKPVMLHLKGWIKQSKLARKEIRYFYVVKSSDIQKFPWMVIADHHKFTLEWHPLQSVVERTVKLAGKQRQWFNRCKNEIEAALSVVS